MDFDGLTTRTTARFEHLLAMNELIINAHEIT